LVLLFLGAWFFDTRGGWFEAKVYTPFAAVPENFQPARGDGPDLQRGGALYQLNCALCHNSDGAGKPNQAPPLVGSEWVIAPGVNRLIRIPQVGLGGTIEVKGQKYDFSAPMAAMGATYNDDDLAAVLSYIRTAWGNKAAFVTAEHVKKVRDELKGRTQAYTVDELKKLPE
jgi:mono/diheme cytochrome c family protein